MRIAPTNYHSKINYSSTTKPKTTNQTETHEDKPTEKKINHKKIALITAGVALTSIAIWQRKNIKNLFNDLTKTPSVVEIKEKEKIAEKATENISETTTEVLTPDIITIPEKRPKIKFNKKHQPEIINIDEKGNVIPNRRTQLKTDRKNEVNDTFDVLTDYVIFDEIINGNHTRIGQRFDEILKGNVKNTFENIADKFDNFVDTLGDKIDDFSTHFDDFADDLGDFGDIF